MNKKKFLCTLLILTMTISITLLVGAENVNSESFQHTHSEVCGEYGEIGFYFLSESEENEIIKQQITDYFAGKNDNVILIDDLTADIGQNNIMQAASVEHIKGSYKGQTVQFIKCKIGGNYQSAPWLDEYGTYNIYACQNCSDTILELVSTYSVTCAHR